MRILIVLLLSLLIAGCSSKEEPTVTESAPPPSDIPAWILEPIVEGGIAETECIPYSGNLSIDKAQVTATARAGLARQIEVKVQVIDKVYQSRTDAAGKVNAGSTFEATSRQIAETHLRGSRVEKTGFIDLDGQNNLCAMIVLSPNSTTEFLDSLVKESGKNVSPQDKDILYQEFKAYKAQQELNETFSN